MAGPTEAQSNNKSVHKAVLPPIMSVDKKDYLPENLLNTLTKTGKKFQNLGPKSSTNNNNSINSSKFSQRRNDNVWNHEKSRGKLKHLLEQPACYCGAGRYFYS